MLTYQKERQLYQKISEAQQDLALGYFPTLFELTRWLQATEGTIGFPSQVLSIFKVLFR